MLARFIAWLDDLLAAEGSPAIVKAVLGILSFAVLLGALLGNAAVKAGALVAALLVLLSGVLVLLADRRATLRRLEVHRRLVSHYTKLASDHDPLEYRVMDWDDFYTVEPNGDTRKRLTMRAHVLVDGLWAVRLEHGCGWPQPAKHRRRVAVVARKLQADDLPGPKLTTTSEWVAEGKFVLIIHFRAALPRGSSFGVVVECDWPGMCVPLMRDHTPDDFMLRFRTPVVRARHRVALPPGSDAYFEPLGFSDGDDGFEVVRAVDESGRPVFGVESTAVPHQESFGMRIELKGRGVVV
ncbi:hypothetical protein FHX81_2372 [Saccharothrix saharensis]|uniref:Uncharacterized protein n=1 Tax=Saccharothrix saharensis TaxID=571190 RepID=A0A543JB44_9PSEU|nr:hypothetical protein [Saccharothrix saharensis]TQM80049.1 hypothetical protein FHX81_2372 [Saccharothrix saharensis]